MQNKRIQIIVIAVFVIILGVCLYYAYPFQSSIKLGLDLKGGTQIILKPNETGTEEVTDSALDQAEMIIMDRIDKLGISEPLITRDYNKNIIIQLPGVDEPQRAIDLIGKTAQLEFRIFESVDQNNKPVR